ncbi:uncharacterized protein LOC144123917 [Amblyomma americanum]
MVEFTRFHSFDSFSVETSAANSKSEEAARWQNLVVNAVLSGHTVPEHGASEGTGCSSWNPAETRNAEHAASEGPGCSSWNHAQTKDAEFVELPLPIQNAAPAAIQTQAPKQDFSYTGDGLFHLTGGIIISGCQAAKILANKKPTLVCKDTAQAVWSNEVLATRSFTGAVAPKQRALGEKPKQHLTPHKVDVVIATMKHWGTIKGVDVSEAVRNVPRMLTEKIQDVKKALRKVDA